MAQVKVLVASLLFTAVMPTATANALDPPPGAGFGSQVHDDHAEVWQRRYATASNRPKHAHRGNPNYATAYEPVCRARSSDAGAHTRVCDDPTAFCPDQSSLTVSSKAFWVVTAATPSPGPDDWTATGAITCTGRKGGPAGSRVLSAAQVRRLPIPAAAVSIQPDPATSSTLINIPTKLYTARRSPVLTTSILGQPVRVRASPTSYRWDYGDGSSRTTADTGGPYPDLSTGHTYARPGRYRISLTTTYTGEYSVAGGPWQPIDGTATVTSPTSTVHALQARDQLVS